MVRILLGLGSNLGNRQSNLKKAIAMLAGVFTLSKLSSVYRTQSLLKDGQNDYFNVVCSCYTEMTAFDVLSFLQKTEKSLGRVKNTGRWGARLIDIDIIDYGGVIMKEPNLVLPHERMFERSFVLYPLYEIEPKYIHPVLGCSVYDMIQKLEDDLSITLIGKLSL